MNTLTCRWQITKVSRIHPLSTSEAILLAWLKNARPQYPVSTYHCLGLGTTGALQVISWDRGAGLTRDVMRELCWVNRLVYGTLQKVVQAAMGPVVWSGTNTKEIWREKERVGGAFQHDKDL